MHCEIFDYRNGKYQGPVTAQKQRHGLGILVDDELSLYVSHWNQNKLQGPTLAYLAHGKYIYGEWSNNEPHGLNVFRCGDTVLVGKFCRGTLAGRCLLIFERHNFACILAQADGQWNILQSGQLLSHRSLLGYLQVLGTPVPEHYLSLTKFACAYSNNSNYIKTYPCGTNCCYFGFINGLAIIFNANNGVVSVGHHRNQELVQFGGRFEGVRSSQQGNFEHGGETVRYVGQRPAAKIQAIFQRLHKRSLNFFNEYFDSRGRIFANIEGLVKGKLKDIGQACRKGQEMEEFDLNDSLDYQDYNEEESLKITQIREKMYSPPKRTREKEKQAASVVAVKDQIYHQPVNYFRKNQYKKKELASSNLPYCVQSNSRVAEQIEQRQGKAKPIWGNPRRSPLKQREAEVERSQVNAPAKTKQKTRTNLKYIDGSLSSLGLTGELDGHRQSKIVCSNPAEFTKVKQTKFIANKGKEEQKKIQYRVLKKEHDDEDSDYRVPTFKALVEDYEQGKSPSSEADHLQDTSTFKNISAVHAKEEGFKLAKRYEMKKYDKRDDDGRESELQATPKRQSAYQVDCSSSSKQTTSEFLLSGEKRKKSIQVNKLARPSYEDIEQRRKRILKSFQQLNQGVKSKADLLLEQDSKGKASGSSDFSYVPLSISNRINQKTGNGKGKDNKVEKVGKCQETFVFSLNKEEKTSVVGKDSKQNAEKVAQPSRLRKQSGLSYINAVSKPKEVQISELQAVRPGRGTVSSPKNATPSRQKRNYQYLYE